MEHVRLPFVPARRLREVLVSVARATGRRDGSRFARAVRRLSAALRDCCAAPRAIRIASAADPADPAVSLARAGPPRAGPLGAVPRRGGRAPPPAAPRAIGGGARDVRGGAARSGLGRRPARSGAGGLWPYAADRRGGAGGLAHHANARRLGGRAGAGLRLGFGLTGLAAGGGEA